MIKNYIKIAVRNLLKHKTYSLINISCLTIGMACTILILLWVQDEFSYETFHKKADQIHQVYHTYFYENSPVSGPLTSAPVAGNLREQYPEIVNSTRFEELEVLLKYKENIFIESKVACTDPSFFEMFTFPFIKGNSKTALSDPHSIVFTKKMAEKYFGDEDPLGKIVRVDNEFDFMVTGVIENIPFNSHRRFDFLIPFVFLKERGHNFEEANNYYFTYVLLDKNVSYQEVSRKIADYPEKYNYPLKAEFRLVPLTGIRLYEDGMINLVYLLSIVALLILLISCINFINLSTARSAYRAREVGIRKVFGANRKELIIQFLGEAVILATIANFTALLLVEIILPAFNRVTFKHLAIDYSDVRFIFSSLSIILFTGIVAGSYPAFFLSSFRPVKILKDNPLLSSFSNGKSRGGGRKTLVVIQFSCSIIFIICMSVIMLQFNHMETTDMGFDDKNVIYMSMRGELQSKYESIKNELLKNPNILNITTSSHQPSMIENFDLIKKDEKKIITGRTWVGYDYIKTFNMKMAQGRFYSKKFSSDRAQKAIIVNESAVKLMGLKSPVGETLRIWDDAEYTIIGVVKDFNSFPLTSIRGASYEGALVLHLSPQNDFMFVKIKPDNSNGSEYTISSTIGFLKNICKKFNPNYPFEYHFLGEDTSEVNKIIGSVYQILLSLTFLVILISCLGLLGLSSFMTEQRTKEIGIRKVLGAKMTNIIQLFSKEYIKLLLIANLIAWPIAYFAMKNYLQMWAYRMNLGIKVFIATGVFVFILALITVSLQAFKTATRNPVEVLMYE